MIRNEYRRAFIMLRAVMPGYGGHVRLERRTLTGSMYFIITAPQGVGELAAALVGHQNGEYYAAPIGPLTRDRRGQLALAWQFDPRGIEGRPLEAYAWVAIVATGGPCALALTGNVEGSRPADARALERAACAVFASMEAPAADLPEPTESPAAAGFGPTASQFPAGSDSTGAPRPTDSDPTATPATPAPSPADATDDSEETRGDVRVYTMTRARLRRLAERNDRANPTPTEAAQPGPDAGMTQDAPGQGAGPEAASPPISAGAASPRPTPEPPTSQTATDDTPTPRPTHATAAQRLGLDITAPWPGASEGLRRLFATQAPAGGAPADGFTYVRAPMPAGSGYAESLVGLKAEGGRITAMRHALPARSAPEPPAGMEACAWFPGEGASGFWVSEEQMSE